MKLITSPWLQIGAAGKYFNPIGNYREIVQEWSTNCRGRSEVVVNNGKVDGKR